MKHVTSPDIHIDLSKPSLQATAFLLRHKEFWPKGFDEFVYMHYDTCAAGLIEKQWGFNPLRDGAKKLGTSPDVTWMLFMLASTISKTENPGPEIIANHIDLYLTGHLREWL